MNKSKAKRQRMIARAVIVVLLVIIGVLVVLLLRPRTDGQIVTTSQRDPNAALGQIEGKTQEEIQAELNRIVEQGMFNVSINPAIEFASGDAEGDMRIENVPGNRYLMRVALTLDDTGETVYTSGILEPNYHIQSSRLDVALPKGTYPATALFTAYEPDVETPVGSAAVKITLYVLS